MSATESQPQPSGADQAPGDGETMSRALAREMVGLFKDFVGRGPTYARAYIHDEVVIVILKDTMIRAEKTLAEEGEENLVRDLRRVFQGKFKDQAVAAVERIVGRPVEAFLSDHEVDSDVAVEVFVLRDSAHP